MKLIDLEHPFFEPVWIRVLVVVICMGWGLFEFANAAVLWGIFFCGIGLICAYRFSVIDYAAIADAAKEPPQNDEA